MLKYIAAILLIGGLALYIARQDERAAQYRAKKAAGSSHDITTKSEEDQAHKDIENTAGDTPGWYRIVRWPDATTTWAIILTLIVIAEQTKETKRGTDSQRDKDRARLIVVGLRDDESLGMGTDMGDFYWAIAIVLRQQGPTKAFNVQGFATVLVRPAHERHPTIQRKQMLLLRDIPSIVEGGDAAIDGTIGFAAIKDADMMKINAGELRAHFFGFVEYEDVFGAKHTTRFRYIWQPEEREDVPGVPGETFQTAAERWQVYGRKKDNYAN